MVCVAAVALSSATYAWFVSNNTVTATTTNISAQSNSAFLLIQSQLLQQVQEQNPDSMKQGERLTMHISEANTSCMLVMMALSFMYIFGWKEPMLIV